jgi:hypothetical protein
MTVSAPRRHIVGWRYADPDGTRHEALNCSIADLSVQVAGTARAPARRLGLVAGAAYELGVLDTDHGITIEPDPDG